jgi:hypothetical protein
LAPDNSVGPVNSNNLFNYSGHSLRTNIYDRHQSTLISKEVRSGATHSTGCPSHDDRSTCN